MTTSLSAPFLTLREQLEKMFTVSDTVRIKCPQCTQEYLYKSSDEIPSDNVFCTCGQLLILYVKMETTIRRVY